ncbi:MAG TPA: xylan 1,4-beta-xylosidase, partial [Asticcacaulis sp.]
GPAAGRIVQLRAEVSPDQSVRFSYSLDDGRSFAPLGEAVPLSRFSWWKGSRPALFSYTTGKAKAGYADFDWLHVETEDRP